MSKSKKRLEVSEVSQDGFYKGYDIRWLRNLGPEHADFHLVAQYDVLMASKVESEE